MRGAIPPLPQYAFMVCYSIKKAEEQLYLYIILQQIQGKGKQFMKLL